MKTSIWFDLPIHAEVNQPLADLLAKAHAHAVAAQAAQQEKLDAAFDKAFGKMTPLEQKRAVLPVAPYIPAWAADEAAQRGDFESGKVTYNDKQLEQEIAELNRKNNKLWEREKNSSQQQ